MKQNLYYRSTFKRFNVFKSSILGLAWAMASYPRLLLEVFIRRDFGHRYFSLSSCITIFVILALLPMARPGYGFSPDTLYYLIFEQPLWYIYLVAFLVFSIKRHKELKVKPGHYDGKWFSMSTGEIHDWFFELKFKGKPFSNRTIEIWLEPAPFFLAGLILILLQSSLGILLVACAIAYNLSYSAAYASGDGIIWDIIDNKLMVDATEKYYVDDEDTEGTKGVRFYTNRPDDKQLGKTISDALNQKDDDGTSYAF